MTEEQPPADQPPADQPPAEQPPGRPSSDQPPRRRRRRVTTEPPPGSDPEPLSEEARHTLEENDERLRAEKPPHY